MERASSWPLPTDVCLCLFSLKCDFYTGQQAECLVMCLLPSLFQASRAAWVPKGWMRSWEWSRGGLGRLSVKIPLYRSSMRVQFHARQISPSPSPVFGAVCIPSSYACKLLLSSAESAQAFQVCYMESLALSKLQSVSFIQFILLMLVKFKNEGWLIFHLTNFLYFVFFWFRMQILIEGAA